ncbi:4'-phosphopantetheinyl transferase family protein [Dyella acidiphila]|uniref:Enterobactin synthase component D n=1 Tax=Dyella acidiphila TaxID=2775866 RepID=A0ABR9GDG4_9GAMM|nr:4'-phosphopantetheinyl transferase superfamily protein [Dyella acidiphila]MBE1162039.1 4'-phosphopantetheinyl transferase superfamily protein [Dyella acidiphila]
MPSSSFRHTEGSDPPSAAPVRRQVTLAAEPQPLLVHVIEFPHDGLVPGAFAQAGIACPEAIQRSVYKRQLEFFFGRLAARDALATLGLAHEHVALGAQRQPVWPSDVIGSITHTHSVAAAVAQRPGAYRGIGIDAEQLIDEPTCQSVASTVAGPQELDYLRALPELSWQAALTIVFSAKESFYKAVYANVGRIFDFSAVHVVKLDSARQRLTLMLAEDLNDRFRRGQAYEAGFTFIRPDTVLTHVVW